MIHLSHFFMSLLLTVDIILAAMIVRHALVVWYHWKYGELVILGLDALSDQLLRQWKYVALISLIMLGVAWLTRVPMVTCLFGALYLLTPFVLDWLHARQQRHSNQK